MHRGANLLQGLARFFRPTLGKLVFLAEWLAFGVLLALRGEFPPAQALGAYLGPLLLFYLAGCILDWQACRETRAPALRAVMFTALALIALDQGWKVAVGQALPEGARIPLLPGWLELTHQRNLHGSYLASLYLAQPRAWLTWLLRLTILPLLVAALPVYGYARQQAQVRARIDWAFLGLFAGAASYLLDSLRGFTLDSLGLPGLVAADWKDVYLSLGAGALFAELAARKTPLLRWRGARAEWQEAQHALRGIWQVARAGWRRPGGKAAEKSAAQNPSQNEKVGLE